MTSAMFLLTSVLAGADPVPAAPAAQAPAAAVAPAAPVTTGAPVISGAPVSSAPIASGAPVVSAPGPSCATGNCGGGYSVGGCGSCASYGTSSFGGGLFSGCNFNLLGNLRGKLGGLFNHGGSDCNSCGTATISSFSGCSSTPAASCGCGGGGLGWTPGHYWGKLKGRFHGNSGCDSGCGGTVGAYSGVTYSGGCNNCGSAPIHGGTVIGAPAGAPIQSGTVIGAPATTGSALPPGATVVPSNTAPATTTPAAPATPAGEPKKLPGGSAMSVPVFPTLTPVAAPRLDDVKSPF